MAFTLKGVLVVGISSRALFDLHVENEIFEAQGLDTYRKYQLEHEEEILEPGSAFPLIKALLSLNQHFTDRRVVEVIVMSRNSPDLGLRVFNSIQHYGLDITRAAFTSGASLVSYLEAFQVDLYLSMNEAEVQQAIDAGHAGAVIYSPPPNFQPTEGEIRIAFDGDAVLFSAESERIYAEQGLEAFEAHEIRLAQEPMSEGPFAKLLRTLSDVQGQFAIGDSPVRIALVTARGSPAHERVIRTLRSWGLHVDEAFFLGGLSKDAILKAFRAHIFFDDQDSHLKSASRFVPAARVPYRTEEVAKLKADGAESGRVGE